MAETGIMTLPLVRGKVEQTVGQSPIAVMSYRVYPFAVGCMVRDDSTDGTCPTHGKGQFQAGDYAMPCIPVSYGDGEKFIPDPSRITRVVSVNDADDELTFSPARSLRSGEYLLNLGADTSAAPTSAPNYDGSTVILYTDNVGNNENGNKYMVTAQDGGYFGWVQETYNVVDLLVSDPDGAPSVLYPMISTGATVIGA